MAVSLQKKNAVKTETWSSALTNLNTENKSCLFMKQLTHGCISTILYLRKILPDDYFESNNFEGMTLKLLKLGKLQKFSKIEKWLEGAFEAIEKKYLKHLMLDIQDAQSNMMLEVYTLTFNYQSGNDSLNILLSSGESSNRGNSRETTVKNTKITTVKLLQMCHAVTQAYSNLPSHVTLGMRLSYHEGTPAEYQPSGYEEWDANDPLFPRRTRSIEIGVTGTRYHLFKLINKSCFNDRLLKDVGCFDKIKDSRLPEEQTCSTQKPPCTTQDKKVSFKRELRFDNSSRNIHPALQSKQKDGDASKSKSVCATRRRETFAVTENITKKGAAPAGLVKSNRRTGLQDQTIRCPCKSTEKSSNMFPCLSCRCFVHAECFGILQFDPTKKILFYCNLCHREEGSRCHDKVMINLKNSSDQQKLALLRRVLKFVYTPNIVKITLHKMKKIAGANCPINVVEIVLNKMIEIGVAIPQRKRKNYLIDKQELGQKLVIYFYELHNSGQSQSKGLPESQTDLDLLKKINSTGENKNVKEKKCSKSTTMPNNIQTCTDDEFTFQGSVDIFD